MTTGKVYIPPRSRNSEDSDSEAERRYRAQGFTTKYRTAWDASPSGRSRPTEHSRIGHVYTAPRLKKRTKYVDASTDTSQDAKLPRQPLPPSSTPPLSKPKEEWIKLWNVVYSEEMATKTYSQRDVTVQERLSLGHPFKDPDEWPVNRIVGQRSVRKSTEYLVEWEPHPKTNEEYEPTWLHKDDVAEDLVKPWWIDCMLLWWKQHSEPDCQLPHDN